MSGRQVYAAFAHTSMCPFTRPVHAHSPTPDNITTDENQLPTKAKQRKIIKGSILSYRYMFNVSSERP